MHALGIKAFGFGFRVVEGLGFMVLDKYYGDGGGVGDKEHKRRGQIAFRVGAEWSSARYSLDEWNGTAAGVY